MQKRTSGEPTGSQRGANGEPTGSQRGLSELLAFIKIDPLENLGNKVQARAPLEIAAVFFDERRCDLPW
jgi:hypothetical protein